MRTLLPTKNLAFYRITLKLVNILLVKFMILLQQKNQDYPCKKLREVYKKQQKQQIYIKMLSLLFISYGDIAGQSLFLTVLRISTHFGFQEKAVFINF